MSGGAAGRAAALPSPESIRAALPERFPLLKTPPPALPYDPRCAVFGLSELGVPVTMPERARFEHAHVIGTTGGGKTNLLEHLIRQDIKKGDGVCVIDPHGSHPDSLYRSLITWLDASGHLGRRKVHLLDPNVPGHTTGFNPLALPSNETSVSVVAGVALEAIERVWGDEDTHSKPTIRRLLKATLAALAELNLTLCEAELLFDKDDVRGVRALTLSKLTDRYARAVLADLDMLARTDRNGTRFRDEVVGPLNRLAEFLSAPAVRRILGQRDGLDLRECLDEGHILLVNLSGGDAVHDTDTELLGRLLTRFLFFHAKRRQSSRPFWFFLDECQRYLSGDIPSLLAEARKFRVSVCLSHQWQSQLGKADGETLAAVHNATNLKVAFRIKHPKEAKEVAEAVMPLSLEQPVEALIRPTVVGHRRTTFRSVAHAESESYSTSSTLTLTESDSESVSHGTGESVSESDGSADIIGDGRASFSGLAQVSGTGASVTMTPDMGWDRPPMPLATMEAISESAAATSGTTTSSMHSASSSQNSSRGRSRSDTNSRAHSAGTSTSHSEGYSYTTSRAEGVSEGLEPVFAELPSAVHSFENTLYFAAQMLRSLPAGQAFMHFVDAEGMKSARVQVPLVSQVTLTNERFIQLRAGILERSVFAKGTENAVRAISEREWVLFKEAQHLKERASEVAEPRNFRVPAPKPNTDPTVHLHAQPRKDGAQAVKGGRLAVAKGERNP
jgi:hypothetical protein